MIPSKIGLMQQKVGAVVDRRYGPETRGKIRTHLLGLMPKPARFPREGSSEFAQFYGRHGDIQMDYTPPMKKIRLPFSLSLFGSGTMIDTISAHEKCADSLLSVFQRLDQAFPSLAQKQEAGILIFDGIYNPRPKRGGSTWSMHAWAVAIDLNAGPNGNNTAWPITAVMPLEVMECFASEGWTPAGAFWGRDAMHFQATSP